MNSKRDCTEDSGEQYDFTGKTTGEMLQAYVAQAKRYSHIRDSAAVSDNYLRVGIQQYLKTNPPVEGEFTEPWNGIEEYYKVVSIVQERLKKKLQNPSFRQAIELVLEAWALLEKKQFEEAIQKISEAASLDPDYMSWIEPMQNAIEMEKRKGPVRLTRAINRILYPRLRKIGFRPDYGEDSIKWNEQTAHLVRINSRGLEGSMDMGRTKFGKRFALAVSRQSSNGEDERLDLGTVGLNEDVLCYLNQEEANAMLERIADEFEGPILAWLDEER